VLVSATLFIELSARERAKLITAKTNAAQMLIQLLAIELAPAVDFGDTGDVTARLSDVRANPDIVRATVWTDLGAPPLAEWAGKDAPTRGGEASHAPDGSTTSEEFLVTTRTMTSPEGGTLGRVQLVFTLRPENEAFRKDRMQLFWMTTGLAAVTALLLVLLARRYVTGPIGTLSRAATALAHGDLAARVRVTSKDEIGELAQAFNVMSEAVAFREERLQKELELAQRIQTSILPHTPEVSGLEIAARMIPTSQVGGDYYDILPVETGAWIGIGEVAGHGLDAGLVMLMLQSTIASLVTWAPEASPADVVCALNQVLYDNIRNRLRRDDHATLSVLRYSKAGEVNFAGAHEELVVYRARSRTCEVVKTPGTWVGGRRDIRRGTVNSSLQLEPGDVLLLHTDGVTEIKSASGEELGLDRVVAELGSVGDQGATAILDRLLGMVTGWGAAEDDVTLVVLRYLGGS